MRVNQKELLCAMFDKGFNTIQLADKSGVSRATISNIRCGKSCSRDTLEKIAGALEISIEKLQNGHC